MTEPLERLRVALADRYRLEGELGAGRGVVKQVGTRGRAVR
jgi:hypothetical protein